MSQITIEDVKIFLDNCPEKIENFELNVDVEHYTIKVSVHYSKNAVVRIGSFVCSPENLSQIYNSLVTILKKNIK